MWVESKADYLDNPGKSENLTCRHLGYLFPESKTPFII